MQDICAFIRLFFFSFPVMMKSCLLLLSAFAGLAASEAAAAGPFSNNRADSLDDTAFQHDLHAGQLLYETTVTPLESLARLRRRRNCYRQPSAVAVLGVIVAALAASYLILQCFMALQAGKAHSAPTRKLGAADNCECTVSRPLPAYTCGKSTTASDSKARRYMWSHVVATPLYLG